MTTYHEKVALVMSQTHSAGTYNTYDQILAAMRRKFPKEEDLRAYVKMMEAEAVASGMVPPDWTLVPDDNLH